MSKSSSLLYIILSLMFSISWSLKISFVSRYLHRFANIFSYAAYFSIVSSVYCFLLRNLFPSMIIFLIAMQSTSTFYIIFFSILFLSSSESKEKLSYFSYPSYPMMHRNIATLISIVFSDKPIVASLFFH